MSLQITEIRHWNSTVWKVIDSDGIEIARFDSRGGYTRADAEAIVREDPESPESQAEEQMARAEMYL